jgi:hypothetical protein
MASISRFCLVVAGALVAWVLWLAEVSWVKGWTGLNWLSGFNWSAVPICALIAGLSAYVASAPDRRHERVRFICAAFIVTFTAFVIGRWAAFELFSGWVSSGRGLRAASALVFSGLLVSVGLTWLANRLLAPLRNWTWIVLLLTLLLVAPLSVATIKVLPALNGSRDEIHAIKMGYPIFWTALLVPLALASGLKRREQP